MVLSLLPDLNRAARARSAHRKRRAKPPSPHSSMPCLSKCLAINLSTVISEKPLVRSRAWPPANHTPLINTIAPGRTSTRARVQQVPRARLPAPALPDESGARSRTSCPRRTSKCRPTCGSRAREVSRPRSRRSTSLAGTASTTLSCAATAPAVATGVAALSSRSFRHGRRLDCGKGADLGGEDAAWLERKDVPIDYETPGLD